MPLPPFIQSLDDGVDGIDDTLLHTSTNRIFRIGTDGRKVLPGDEAKLRRIGDTREMFVSCIGCEAANRIL